MFGIEGCALTRRRFLAAAGLSLAAGAAPLGRAAADEARPPRHVVVSDRNDAKTYVLAFDKGQEMMASLLAFARKERLTSGGLTGIGAVSGAVLAFFDRKAGEYKHIPVAEQAEVASLIGNVSLVDGEPFLHVHAVLGLPDGSARVGHVLEAHVWPTLEVVLTTWTQRVRRDRDKDTGLELMRP
jgi:predicted DNA-binding protein with PD1-like motif